MFAVGAAPPTAAKLDSRRMLLACPNGQVAGLLDSAIGRCCSKRVSHSLQRYS